MHLNACSRRGLIPLASQYETLPKSFYSRRFFQLFNQLQFPHFGREMRRNANAKTQLAVLVSLDHNKLIESPKDITGCP